MDWGHIRSKDHILLQYFLMKVATFGSCLLSSPNASLKGKCHANKVVGNRFTSSKVHYWASPLRCVCFRCQSHRRVNNPIVSINSRPSGRTQQRVNHQHTLITPLAAPADGFHATHITISPRRVSESPPPQTHEHTQTHTHITWPHNSYLPSPISVAANSFLSNDCPRKPPAHSLMQIIEIES